MTIASFDLLQPRSLEEAVALLQQYGDDSRPLGGGTTLIILLKQRVVRYRVLVDLQSIPGLADIRRDTDGVRIGALATHRKVETSELIRESFPALAYAFSQIGNVRVRQTASVGGNLAHGDYRLDPPPPLLVLNAAVHLFGPDGARTVPIREFFTGTYETALRPGELVTSITTDRRGGWVDEATIAYSSGGRDYELDIHWTYITCGTAINELWTDDSMPAPCTRPRS